MAASNTSNSGSSSQRTETLTLEAEIKQRLKPLIIRLVKQEPGETASVEQHENSFYVQMDELRKVVEKQLQEIQGRVLARRPKGKTNADDSAANQAYMRLLMVVKRIVDDMKEVLTTISYRQRLFIHQMMHALRNNGDRRAVHDELEEDINYQLKRWDTYLDRIEEYLQAD
ncbi:unnamed protein product [Rotaria socialis]|uniref:Uncharacterized protein n=1 Tax=Rotaria socialis TaxID=392032 RepID=A0A817X019_9BILA|nr:unnamed protein product [Rotaria socialis]CAF3436415.1 unnamed protein product [Rotaria socialis]CAF4496153.1 unnamed protein product [Rotaria socialis]CAF4524686.1 unnamed protein product [Rotaria socialis]